MNKNNREKSDSLYPKEVFDNIKIVSAIIAVIWGIYIAFSYNTVIGAIVLGIMVWALVAFAIGGFYLLFTGRNILIGIYQILFFIAVVIAYYFLDKYYHDIF